MVSLTADMLQSRAWRFLRHDGTVIAPQLRLLPGGRIAMHGHPNESSWTLRGNVVRFHDPGGRVMTSFDQVMHDDGLRLEGTFLNEAGHFLHETPRLERLAHGGEAIVPLDRGTACRPNLVVLRADRSSLHPTWVRDLAPADRSWDLCISWYGADCELGLDPDADYEALQSADRKFVASWKLFAEGSPFWRYEHVMFPDDDLIMSWSGINRVFETMRAYELLLAQPSLTHESCITHELTRNNPDCLLRFVEFVESMTPVFSREALAACMPTFGMSLIGYGLDHIWPKLLGAPPNRIAILDDTAVTHTRPVATHYHHMDAIREGQGVMAAFGAWETYRELGRIYRPAS